ncbi:Branched-chain amino acid transport ATP-binding protein LivG [Pseudomonas chlororaphis subsp. aurantiaca]|nr:Branched-chain amino acid transport ATP-binding protein LivG [Pseudomonas chlororaphis subsp. aurantiaca]AZD43283.1 Branched-chain amino acid transport ATP-binding protein LivG [Pseudomonas chlororaphis subsp. aurantiaca]AZD49526.1 Branched-chain amino acid transport ATP-binding protein LivG [Pseudomonas chlororaphis subsp. aurantiaca]AZD80649.1 Branched-chain amino acid transport ATP-binding protein LivG [Pseudomonas chlororaphis subsp. aurantiaca]AZE43538.1 Branched-chain amino acid transp
MVTLAGMNASETEGLRQLMCKMKGHGKTVLLIEHDVKSVMGLRDHVTVLEFGEKHR